MARVDTATGEIKAPTLYEITGDLAALFEADADAAAGDQASGAFDGPEYHEGLGDDLDAEASPSDLEG